MYTLSIFIRNKERKIQLSLEDACRFARIYWHLSPRIEDAFGKPVLADGLILEF